VTYHPKTACCGDISDIIGEHIGDFELSGSETDFEIGISLNPLSTVREIVGGPFDMFGPKFKAAMKDLATPGTLPWDLGRTKGQNQRLSEVYSRFTRGEQPSERGGKRVHNGGFSLLEVQQADKREKMYRASLSPEDAAARAAKFKQAGDAAHASRMRNRGFNPIRSVSRAVKTVTNPLTKPIGRTIDKIPLAGDVLRFTTQRANLVFTPARFLYGAGTGFLKGGFKGASRGVKEQAKVTAREGRRFIQNPVVRYGTKGAALIFPPLAPVAAGVEAANQVIAAIEGKDPIKAAFAIATVANSVAAANGGDLDALRAVKTIKAVRQGIDLAGKAKDVAKTVSFAIPKGATKTQALTAANALINAAKGAGTAKAKAAALAIISNTAKAAKKGDPKAKAGAVILKAVHTAHKKVAFKKAAVSRGSFKKANRAAKGAKYSGAYLVDSKGRVVKGNFSATG
jgi:hypothetical protein